MRIYTDTESILKKIAEPLIESKPLLLTFGTGHAHRLDRAMLKQMADHFGWTETQTIHVALTRMFFTTFGEYVDVGPISKKNLSKSSNSTNLQSPEHETLSDWVTAAKDRLKIKAKTTAKTAAKKNTSAKKIAPETKKTSTKPLKVAAKVTSKDVSKVAKKVATKARSKK